MPDFLQAHMSEFKDRSASKVPYYLVFICETTQKENQSILSQCQSLGSKWGVFGAGQGFDPGNSTPFSLSLLMYRDLDGHM